MKRALVAVLVLVAGMAGVFVYNGVTREQEYRRLVAAGEQALRDDQTFLAIEALSGAIAIKPDAMIAYLKRGEAYRARGEPAAAVRDLVVAARLDPSATRPLEQLGDLQASLSQYAEAAAYYERYVQLDDRNPAILYKLALSRYGEGDTAAAAFILRQAIAQDDGFAEAYYLLGLCLREADQTEEAVEALRRAIALEPAFIEARQALVSVYRALEQASQEVEQLEALAVLDRSRAERDVSLALAYARAGYTELAINALGRAIEEHPDQPMAYAALGRIWLNLAETRGDRVDLNKALEALRTISSTTAPSATLALLGRALELAGDVDGAVRAYQQATERFPVDPVAFQRLAALTEQRGDVATARDLFIRHHVLTADAIEARPRVLSAVRIGELSMQLDEAGVAADWFQRAVDLSPADPWLLRRLAEARWRAGDVERARTVVSAGLERYPENPSLLALQRRLQ